VAHEYDGNRTLAAADERLCFAFELPCTVGVGACNLAQGAIHHEAVAECELCIERKLPIPAYEQAIKASHVFNTLQARGVISVAERQAYIGRVRDLSKAACGAWLERTA